MSKKDSTLLKQGQTWYVSKPPPPPFKRQQGYKVTGIYNSMDFLNTGLWNNFLFKGKRNPDFLK